MYSDAYVECGAVNDAMFETLKEVSIAKNLLGGRPVASLRDSEREELATAIRRVSGRLEFFEAALDVSHQEWEAILSGKFRNDLGGGVK